MPVFTISPEPHESEAVIKQLHHIAVRKFHILQVHVPYSDKNIFVIHHEGWRYVLEQPHIVKASNRKTGTCMVINFESDNTTQLSKVMLEIVHKILANRPT